jgi:hypothetical protein
MVESPILIHMNISHCRELLKLDISAEKRSVIERLIAEAQADLTLAATA